MRGRIGSPTGRPAVKHQDIDFALVGRLIRHRWRVLVALALLGGLIGLGLSFVLSPGYVSDSKVLLQGERDKDALPGEAEVATSSIVLDRSAQELGWGVTGSDLRGHVSADVELNVIQIHGSASAPEEAQQLTDRVTTEYVAFAAQISGAGASSPAPPPTADLQRVVDDSNATIRRLQDSPDADSSGADGDRIRGEIARAQQDVARANAQLRQADDPDASSGSSSQVRPTGSVIQPATLPTGTSSPTMIQLIAGGAVLLVAAGILVHLVRLRLDPRLWDPDEVGAALGTDVLGSVEVARPAGVVPSGLSGVLHDDRRWTGTESVPIEDARTRATRLRRIVGRLRAIHPTPTGRLDVLVVVVEDDTAAVAMVPDLAVAAAEDGPVRLVGLDEDASGAVLRAAADDGVDDRVSVGPEPPPVEARTAYEVVTVSLDHLLVPDSGASPVVVVVTLGTRTGLELAGLATACADAGRDLIGVVLAVPRYVENLPDAESADDVREDGAADPAISGAGGS